MAKKELSVGTTVTRKETGQIGKIVNLYSGSYIVELSDGDGYKHETRVVTQDSMENDYTTQKKAASFQLTADAENVDFHRVLDQWKQMLGNLMIKSVTDNNPVPPSEKCTAEILAFAEKAAEDAAIQQSGEIFTGALGMIAESSAQAALAAREKDNERTYAELKKIMSGPALAKATQNYEANKEKLAAKKTAKEAAKAKVKPSAYMDPKYMEQIAQAIWIKTDILAYIDAKAHQVINDVVEKPGNKEAFLNRVKEKYAEAVDMPLASDEAALEQAKNDLYAAVFEQPAPPDANSLAMFGLTKDEVDAIMPEIMAQHHAKLRSLSAVTSDFKRELENPKVKDPAAPGYLPDMFAVMRKVLPGDISYRLMTQVDKTNTPAEIFDAMISNAVATLTRPRTGTQTKRLNHEPKATGPGESGKKTGLSESIFPEFASASPIAEEKAMLNLRQEFIRSLAAGDMESANRQFQGMQDTIKSYQELYPKEKMTTLGEGDVSTPEKTAAHDEYKAGASALSRFIPSWLDSAETRILKPPSIREESDGEAKAAPATPGKYHPAKPAKSPRVPSMGPRISSPNGYGTGQPVKFTGHPGVHFIVSYDDHNPLKLYLIAEQDVNSHDRTELVEANLQDVQPLKVYNIDIGDVVDAFGSVGRVTDASAKDLGFVYAELRGGNIVPIELAKTSTNWHYAEPIELCRCANDGGVITPGHAAECPNEGHPVPFMGVNMPAKKNKSEVTPPMDAKKQAAIDLMAALDNLDPKIFPAEAAAPAAELYEDESNPIEIGSTVKKFGTMTTGTVVGFKRNCLVVDWENGASESCWKQELVLVTRQEDASY
jgi:hypothetical protein